jgi:4-alpha-glucanotransferase
MKLVLIKIVFKIDYYTHWGQRLFVSGNIPELGNGDLESALEMSYFNGEQWELALNLKVSKTRELKYFYFVKDENGRIIKEWGEDRILKLKLLMSRDLVIYDQWKAESNNQNVFYTSPFRNVFFKEKEINEIDRQANKKNKITHIFTLRLPINSDGHAVCIIGSTKKFGRWDKSKPIILDRISYDTYRVELDLSDMDFPLEYKYGFYDITTKRIVEFEAGKNRKILLSPRVEERRVIINDENFVRENVDWKAAGVAIPIFSLRTQKSFGVGEFLDLKQMIDWANKTNLKLIQVLPINDSMAARGWMDSNPYSAISVFALHPIYLNIDRLGKLASSFTQRIIDDLKIELNNNLSVDYEKVLNAKIRYIKQVFTDNRDVLKRNTKYKKFVKENEEWLKPYAAFSFLRDLNNTSDFSKWGRFSNYSSRILAEITSEKSKHFVDVEVYYFIQFHLHQQMMEVRDYAHKKGIILKGDIPIGIFRNSVDAWTTPQLFNMEMQAGAPPDSFSIKGQNWGSPTYNWSVMAIDDYAWWKKRLSKLSQYFDAIRLDHILGFFRIWQIPTHAIEGILGYFNPATPLKLSEFIEKGLRFNPLRYSKPYIREHILISVFNDNLEYVKSNFLVEKTQGTYILKEEFDTQQKVATYFGDISNLSKLDKSEIEDVKQGLFDLISDIMFIEVNGESGKEYHPRINLHSTFSYKELDEDSKAIVDYFYSDYFYNKQESLWKSNALDILPSLKYATNMLVCGEDLGMVPRVVNEVMYELGILSLEVQRMPKDTNKEFFHPAEASYLSVVTTSTHDTSTLRAWWEEDYKRSQRFYNQTLGDEGVAPFYADSWLITEVMNQHFYSPAMWTIIPLQDLLALDDDIKLSNSSAEQINDPSNPSQYWQYRMHIDIEELLREDELNNKIKYLVEKSGR